MTAEQVRRHLAPDESLDVVGSGTLLADTGHEAVSIGLTDRRLLCVSGAETFVSVGYDDVSLVRTRRRTRTAVRGADYRLLMAAGTLFAAVAFVGVVDLESGLLAPVSTLLAAASIAVAVSRRRDASGVEWEAVVEYASGIVDDVDGVDGIRRTGGRLVADVGEADDDRLLLVGGSLLGVLAFVGVVLFATRALVPFLALVVVCGATLVAYAYRRRADFDCVAVVKRRERIVSIDTTGGRTVEVRVDRDDDVDRQLCRVAYAERPRLPRRSKLGTE